MAGADAVYSIFLAGNRSVQERNLYILFGCMMVLSNALHKAAKPPETYAVHPVKLYQNIENFRFFPCWVTVDFLTLLHVPLHNFSIMVG